jgi:hypothetical protein
VARSRQAQNDEWARQAEERRNAAQPDPSQLMDATRPQTAASATRQLPKKSSEQEQPRDPYQMGPSNYVPFERYAESNKAASEATAKRLGQQVSGEAQQAQDALQKEYGEFGAAADAGRFGRQYTGPAGYNPSDALRQQFLKAQHDAAALGSVEGVRQFLGPKGSMFGAELAMHEGKPQFGRIQREASALGGRLSEAQRGAEKYAKWAQNNMITPASYMPLPRFGGFRSEEEYQRAMDANREQQEELDRLYDQMQQDAGLSDAQR